MVSLKISPGKCFFHPKLLLCIVKCLFPRYLWENHTSQKDFCPSLLLSKLILIGFQKMAAAHVVLVSQRHLYWDWLGVKILGHMTTELLRHWLGVLHILQCHLWVWVGPTGLS